MFVFQFWILHHLKSLMLMNLALFNPRISQLCLIISNAYASPRHVNACWLQVAVKKSKSPRGCSLVHQGRSTNQHSQHTFNWKLHTNNPRNAERFTQTPTMMMLLNIYLPSNMAIFWVSVIKKNQGEYLGAFTTIMVKMYYVHFPWLFIFKLHTVHVQYIKGNYISCAFRR